MSAAASAAASSTQQWRLRKLSNFDSVDEIARWRTHIEKERRVSVYQWPNTWDFLIDLYAKMNASLVNHDASVMEAPTAKFDTFAVLSDSEKQRRTSRRETSFPQTTSGLIGWRSAKTGGTRLEMYGMHARPIGDICKRLSWPPGCGE